jgi:SAM-dependent methyltransferase
MSDIVATNNGYGWTSAEPNQITLALLDWVASLGGGPLILDIGAGFGVGTLSMLDAGAKVIALDLDASHLASIRNEAVLRRTQARLITAVGEFPDCLRFEELDAIHCSNVLHFLSGSEIETGAQLMRSWLKPGGRVFIQVGTIYAGHIKRLLPVFEQRRSSGILWAGETKVARDFVSNEFSDSIPMFMNFLDELPVTLAFKAAGFKIDKAWYYTRHGLPDALRSDGREHFGLIASLP